ncbi:sensor histidine kinase [Halorubrum ezzemoulense]|uniref:sensor histidine kinase n=1 Tax=Halorubrum ezzemoulense TaxID=337243 RepID=UPI000AD22816|nr:ATP-binding protein [Halorubrum ezzemoulense]
MENLFRNSVEHGGEDVTVRVGAIPNGFYVEDTGAGIRDDLRDRPFEDGVTTGEGGAGLGLTIVKQIATAHGWEIGVEQSAEGGARFAFTGVEFPDG